MASSLSLVVVFSLLLSSALVQSMTVITTFVDMDFETEAPWLDTTAPWTRSTGEAAWEWGTFSGVPPPPRGTNFVATQCGTEPCDALGTTLETPTIDLSYPFANSDYLIVLTFDYALSTDSTLKISVDSGSGYVPLPDKTFFNAAWATEKNSAILKGNTQIKVKFEADRAGVALDNFKIYAFNTSCFLEQPTPGCASACVEDCVCNGTDSIDCCEFNWDSVCVETAYTQKCDITCGTYFPHTTTAEAVSSTSPEETTRPGTEDNVNTTTDNDATMTVTKTTAATSNPTTTSSKSTPQTTQDTEDRSDASRLFSSLVVAFCSLLAIF